MAWSWDSLGVIVSPDVVSKRVGSVWIFVSERLDRVTARFRSMSVATGSTAVPSHESCRQQSTHVLLYTARVPPEGVSGSTAVPCDPRHNAVPCQTTTYTGAPERESVSKRPVANFGRRLGLSETVPVEICRSGSCLVRPHPHCEKVSTDGTNRGPYEAVPRRVLVDRP